MKTIHTPGPWILSGSEVDKNGRVHAKVDTSHPIPRGADYPGLVAHVYAKGAGEEGRREQEANARLIAAAPDLLSALERLARAARNRDNHEGSPIRLFETKGELADAEREARAAIAKATGKGEAE